MLIKLNAAMQNKPVLLLFRCRRSVTLFLRKKFGNFRHTTRLSITNRCKVISSQKPSSFGPPCSSVIHKNRFSRTSTENVQKFSVANWEGGPLAPTLWIRHCHVILLVVRLSVRLCVTWCHISRRRARCTQHLNALHKTRACRRLHLTDQAPSSSSSSISSPSFLTPPPARTPALLADFLHPTLCLLAGARI